jgi:hypothetical protein
MFSAIAAILLYSAFSQASSLPTVDLGYAIHQGTLNVKLQIHLTLSTAQLTRNQSSGPSSYYNFSNIRYGQPPLGSLRFSAPLPPQGKNTTITFGQQSVICPQASPGQSYFSNTLERI